MNTVDKLYHNLVQITMHISAMKNKAVSYYFDSAMKITENADRFIDLADSAERYVENHAEDFVSEDIARLKSMASLFRQRDSTLQEIFDESQV